MGEQVTLPFQVVKERAPSGPVRKQCHPQGTVSSVRTGLEHSKGRRVGAATAGHCGITLSCEGAGDRGVTTQPAKATDGAAALGRM